MKIIYRPADETAAREFVQWKYLPPYDMYNCPQDEVEKAIQYNIDLANNVYAMFNLKGELFGYCSFGADAQVPGGDYSEEALDLGLMLKPELTGQGMGAAFVEDVIQNGVDKYAPEKLRVTIAAFNTRAIRTWEKHGFEQTQSFEREDDGMEFVVMIKNLSI